MSTVSPENIAARLAAGLGGVHISNGEVVKPVPTADDIIRWLQPTVDPGSVIELRAIGCMDNPKYKLFTMAGWFDTDHVGALAEAAMRCTLRAQAVWTSINPVDPALHARAYNRVIKIDQGLGTKDENILWRRGIVFDADPIRPAGISATDEEKAFAWEKAQAIASFLSSHRWPAPIVVDSGNGYHVKYRIDLANNEGSHALVTAVLTAVHKIFTDEHVKIDIAMANASRFIKLAGTMARKGDEIPGRPHRWSRQLSAPSEFLVVPSDCLEVIAAMVKPKESSANGKHNSAKSGPNSKQKASSGAGIYYPKDGVSVFDDFDAKADWFSDVLGIGWTKDTTLPDGEIRVTRPGKTGGTSATIGHEGRDVFHVFTDSVDASPFQANGTYNRVQAYAVLNHGGDMAATAKALSERGYGTWIDDDGNECQNPPPKNWRPKGSESGRGGAAAVGLEWDKLTDEELGIVSGDSIDPVPVNWLWPSRIAIGKMNILAGEGKQGKTQMALAIAAAVSTGGELPGGGGQVERGTVVILSAEDDPEDTLVPRLIALGADLTKIKIIKDHYALKRPGKDPEISPVTLRDTMYWKAVFRRFPDLKLLIADPLPSFLGRGVNDHKNAEIREALTPFIALMARFKIALLAITHLSKSVDPKRPASARIIGSIAYANLARSIHFVAKDPDNPKRRLFMMAENTSAANDLPAVAFMLEPRDVVGKGGEVFQIWVPSFEDSMVDVDVDKVVNSDVPSEKRRGPEPNTMKPLALWVVDYLVSENRPVRRGDLYNAAGDAGFLGDYGPQKDGKIRWSQGWKLPRAIGLIPHLGGDRAGLSTDEMTADGAVYYALQGKPAKPAKPGNKAF